MLVLIAGVTQAVNGSGFVNQRESFAGSNPVSGSNKLSYVSSVSAVSHGRFPFCKGEFDSHMILQNRKAKVITK